MKVIPLLGQGKCKEILGIFIYSCCRHTKELHQNKYLPFRDHIINKQHPEWSTVVKYCMDGKNNTVSYKFSRTILLCATRTLYR